MKKIAGYITRIRKELGISQKDVAEEFTKRGFPISNKSIWAWENEKAVPNAEQFLLLCDILKINDIRAAFQRHEIPSLLADLNQAGIEKVQEYANLLRLSGLYSPPSAVIIPIRRKMKRFLLPASAGSGQFLDQDYYDEIEVGDEVPQSADFGVTVSGDSMEPQFIHGQTVWVHKQVELSDGEIGIFFYEGDAYIKKLGHANGMVCLISLNQKYAPIYVRSDAELKVFGKVVG